MASSFPLVNSASYSKPLQAALIQPKAYGSITGYAQLTSVLDATPGALTTREVGKAFLDATLGRGPAGLSALHRYGNVAGPTQLPSTRWRRWMVNGVPGRHCGHNYEMKSGARFD
ncbi:MAG: hypothetical protein ACYCO3_00550 [Mycobacteriales bacterium]